MSLLAWLMVLLTAKTLDKSKILMPCRAPPAGMWEPASVTVAKHRAFFDHEIFVSRIVEWLHGA
jgi:hypothetical protein